MSQHEVEHTETTGHEPQDQHLSLGRYLQRERLKRNIPLETISEATGILHQTLQAMEADDRDRLPANVFIRGFIKLYTKELGINPDFALELFSRGHDPNDSGRYNRDLLSNETLAEARTLVSWRKVLAIFILVIVMLFLYIAWQTYPVLQNAALLQRMQLASREANTQNVPAQKTAGHKQAGLGKPARSPASPLLSLLSAKES